MSDKIVKINQRNIEEKYFEYLRPISKDDGLKLQPDKEDIEKNKVKFEEFFNKYSFFDDFLVKTDLGNIIIKASIYPSCTEKYVNRVENKSFLLKKRKKQNSMYDYFVKDNTDIIDFDRFALAILDIAILGEKGQFSKILMSKELIKDLSEYFDGKGKDNYINFLANLSDNDLEKFSLKIYNYKKLMGKFNEKNTMINFSEDEINRMAVLLYPTDVAAMIKYSECGMQMYDLFVDKIEKYKDNENAILRKLIIDTLTSKNLEPYINRERFYKLAMYRILEFLNENNYFIDKSYSEEENFKIFIELTDKLYFEIKKIEETDKEELPIINYKKSDDAYISFLTAKDLLNKYDKDFSEFLISMFNQDENYVYYVLRTPNLKITEDSFLSLIDLVENKEDLIYIGYSKLGVINKDKLMELFATLDVDKINNIATKLIINNDPNLSYFIEKGLITGLDYRVLYDNGTISVKDIKNALNISNEGFRKKGLAFSGVRLAELYKTIYSKDIIKILQNKERYSEKDIKRVIEENPALGFDISNKDLIKFKKELRFQKDMFKEFATEEDIDQFVETLGEDLGISSYIAIDLFNKDIINEEQAKSMDGIFFKKFIESKNESRFLNTLTSKDVISNKNKLLNLISHKRISDADIIKYYAKGIIPEDLYRELDKTNFKGKVDSKHLTDLAEKLKISGKYTDYNEIERYFKECKIYADTDDFFKSYDEKIASSKKIDQLQLVELGRRGLLSKNSLLTILERGDIGVIVRLIKGENTIDLDETRELFLDLYNSENTHAKRDLLEKVLKQGQFSNDEIFSILLSTYRGMDDEVSEEQKELNNENLQYFFNKGFMNIDVNEENVKKNSSGRKNTFSGNGSSNDFDSQRRFPLFERFDCLFSIDKSSVFNKKGPALVFDVKKYGKTVIETLGTIKDEILQNDLTNHRTFIMDSDTFERYKDEFITELNGKEIVQFKKLIEWFDDNKDVLDLSECKHTKNWKENIKKKIGVNLDDSDSGDISLSISSYKTIIH